MIFKNKYNIIAIGLILSLIFFMIGIGGRHSSGNFLFIIFSISTLIPIVLYFTYEKNKKTKKIADNRIKLEKFKQTADKIKIDLEKVQIKSNSWTETSIIDNSKYAGFNQIAGHGDKNIKNLKRQLNQITIRIPYRNKILNYNTNIDMDTTKLKLHFAIKKETYFYINSNDSNECYLDLEFLND